MGAQQDRFSRTLQHWSELATRNQDLVILGDINLCYKKWSGTGDTQQVLIDKVKAVQVTHALEQLIDQPTRSQLVEGVVNQSIIDHLYTNCSNKLSTPQVISIGDSDHLGIKVSKPR